MKLKSLILDIIKLLSFVLGLSGFLVIMTAAGTSDYESMVTKEVVHSDADIVSICIKGFLIIIVAVLTYYFGNLLLGDKCDEDEYSELYR